MNYKLDKNIIVVICAIVIFVHMVVSCYSEKQIESNAFQGENILMALDDFERIDVEGYVPYYRDEERGALAINSIDYPNEFGAAETEWDGIGGIYNVTIKTMPEEDGECTYRLYIDNRYIGKFVNPETDEPFGNASHTWTEVKINSGSIIRISSNTHSNGLIPENDGYAWARGRWTQLVFEQVL